MSTSEQVRIPALTTRSWWRWVIATGVGGVALVAWAFASGTGPVWARLAVAGAVVVLALLILTTRMWLNPSTGEITVARFGVWRRKLDLSRASAVQIIGVGGLVSVQLRAAGHRGPRTIPVLSRTDYGDATLAPDVLGVLAQSVKEFVPADVASDVPARLRAQAAFLQAGGTVGDSPFAALARSGAARGVGAAGAAGGGTSLLP